MKKKGISFQEEYRFRKLTPEMKWKETKENQMQHQLWICWVKRKQIPLWVVCAWSLCWNDFFYAAHPFWPTLLLEDGGNKFDQKSIQQEPFLFHLQVFLAGEEKIDDCWQRKKMDEVEKGKTPSTTHVPHTHHQSRAFPRLSKYRLSKWNDNEGKGRLYLVCVNNEDDPCKGFDCRGVEWWRESTKSRTLLSSWLLHEKKRSERFRTRRSLSLRGRIVRVFSTLTVSDKSLCNFLHHLFDFRIWRW